MKNIKTLNNVYLFCYVDSEQENLLYHFVNYYKSLGIPTSNWKILLYCKPNNELKKQSSEKILIENNIKYDITTTYFNRLQKRKTEEFMNTIETGWFLYPDLDEFYDYKQNLEDLILFCEKNNINLIGGKQIERFTPDLELKKIEKSDNIFSIFSNTDQSVWDSISKKIQIYDPFKRLPTLLDRIMLIKIEKEKKQECIKSYSLMPDILNSYNHHPELFVINHFRWSYYARKCVANKFLIYKELNNHTRMAFYFNQYRLFYQDKNKTYINIK